jgi:hypothetical protein
VDEFICVYIVNHPYIDTNVRGREIPNAERERRRRLNERETEKGG